MAEGLEVWRKDEGAQHTTKPLCLWDCPVRCQEWRGRWMRALEGKGVSGRAVGGVLIRPDVCDEVK